MGSRGKGKGSHVPEEEVTDSHKGRGRSLVKGSGKKGKNSKSNRAGEPAHDEPATTIAAPAEAKHKAKRARFSPSADFGDISAPSKRSLSFEEDLEKPQKSSRRTSQEYYEFDEDNTRVVPRSHKAASSVGKGDGHHNKGKAHGKGKGSYKGKGDAKGKGCEQAAGSKGMGGKTKPKAKAKAKPKTKAASKRKTGDDDYEHSDDYYKTPVKKRPAASRAPMGITPPGKDYGSLGLETPADGGDDDSPDKPFQDGVSIYSTKGGKRQHREWYSSSYTSVWHMPVGHLQSWLRFVAPTLFTIIYIKKISQCVNQCRDILLAYLIVLTGVGPLDGLPSYNIAECHDALKMEHERLGEPYKKWMKPHEFDDVIAAARKLIGPEDLEVCEENYIFWDAPYDVARPRDITRSRGKKQKGSKLPLTKQDLKNIDLDDVHFPVNISSYLGDGNATWQLNAWVENVLVSSAELPEPDPQEMFWQLYAEPAVNGDPYEPFWHCYSGDLEPTLCHTYLGKYGKMVPHAQHVKDIVKVKKEPGTVKPIEPSVPPLPGMTKNQKTPKDDQTRDYGLEGEEEDCAEQGEEEAEEYDQEDDDHDIDDKEKDTADHSDHADSEAIGALQDRDMNIDKGSAKPAVGGSRDDDFSDFDEKPDPVNEVPKIDIPKIAKDDNNAMWLQWKGKEVEIPSKDWVLNDVNGQWVIHNNSARKRIDALINLARAREISVPHEVSHEKPPEKTSPADATAEPAKAQAAEPSEADGKDGNENQNADGGDKNKSTEAT